MRWFILSVLNVPLLVILFTFLCQLPAICKIIANWQKECVWSCWYDNKINFTIAKWLQNDNEHSLLKWLWFEWQQCYWNLSNYYDHESKWIRGQKWFYTILSKLWQRYKWIKIAISSFENFVNIEILIFPFLLVITCNILEWMKIMYNMMFLSYFTDFNLSQWTNYLFHNCWISTPLTLLHILYFLTN